MTDDTPAPADATLDHLLSRLGDAWLFDDASASVSATEDAIRSHVSRITAERDEARQWGTATRDRLVGDLRSAWQERDAARDERDEWRGKYEAAGKERDEARAEIAEFDSVLRAEPYKMVQAYICWTCRQVEYKDVSEHDSFEVCPRCSARRYVLPVVFRPKDEAPVSDKPSEPTAKCGELMTPAVMGIAYYCDLPQGHIGSHQCQMAIGTMEWPRSVPAEPTASEPTLAEKLVASYNEQEATYPKCAGCGLRYCECNASTASVQERAERIADKFFDGMHRMMPSVLASEIVAEFGGAPQAEDAERGCDVCEWRYEGAIGDGYYIAGCGHQSYSTAGRPPTSCTHCRKPVVAAKGEVCNG